jgi:hypothetical protein
MPHLTYSPLFCYPNNIKIMKLHSHAITFLHSIPNVPLSVLLSRVSNLRDLTASERWLQGYDAVCAYTDTNVMEVPAASILRVGSTSIRKVDTHIPKYTASPTWNLNPQSTFSLQGTRLSFMLILNSRYSYIFRSRNSSVGIATGYGLDEHISIADMSVQTGSGAHPASYPVGTELFPQRQSDQGV